MSKELKEFCETAFISFGIIALAATIATLSEEYTNADLVFQISFTLALLAHVIYTTLKTWQYLGLWSIFLSTTIAGAFTEGWLKLGIGTIGAIAAVLMLWRADTKKRFRNNR